SVLRRLAGRRLSASRVSRKQGGGVKGFVPTPPRTVDAMVKRLFDGRPPEKSSRLLDPGCGHGVFIEGVLRWCRRNKAPRPSIIGIELDPEKLRQARKTLRGEPDVALI